MEEEKPSLNPDVLPAKGLHQPLVRSWRLKTEASVGRWNDAKVGMYLCPKRGVFYARVPETDDGTLYVGKTLPDLQEQVQTALKVWTEKEDFKAEGERAWERCIRIRYSGGGDYIGDMVTAEKTSSKIGYVSIPPRGINSCPELGVLTYARFERSLQPDGDRYDEREWEEDYKERTRVWEGLARGGRARFTIEEHRKKRPVRVRRMSWTRPDRYMKKKYQVVPYTEQTWEKLQELSRQFSSIHAALSRILLEGNEEQLLVALHGGRLLPVKGG